MGVGVGYICILLVLTLWTRAFLLIARAEGRRPIGANLSDTGTLMLLFLYFYDLFAFFLRWGCGYFGWLLFLASGGLLLLLFRCRLT